MTTSATVTITLGDEAIPVAKVNARWLRRVLRSAQVYGDADQAQAVDTLVSHLMLAEREELRGDPVDTNQSKTVDADGVLVYSATGEPVFPGPTGVRR